MSDLITSNLRPIPILTYHQIAPTPPKGTPFRSLCVSPKSFASQMRLLKLLGYQGLSMSALMPYLRGEKTGKVVGITFDDGYLNNLTHALPVLQNLGFSSTCYVVSGLLGKANSWDLAKGVPQVPLMTQSQLHEWSRGGQEVGAHTVSHAWLPQLDLPASAFEISECRRTLEDLLDRPINHFCYPYGQYSAAHVSQVRDAGYGSATTTQRGRVHQGVSFMELLRVPILRSTHPLLFIWKLVSNYEDRGQTLNPLTTRISAI